MIQLSYIDIATAIAIAGVRVGKRPNERLKGNSPIGALLDELNKRLIEKQSP